MRPELLVPLLLLVLLTIAAAALLVLPPAMRRERIAARLQALHADAADAKAGQRTVPGNLLVGLGDALIRGGLVPRSLLEQWQAMLVAANFRRDASLAMFAGAKLALLVVAPIIAGVLLHHSHFADHTLAGAVIAGICGLVLPDMVVGRLRRRYLAAVERGLPDALDMLLMCSGAGLGMEAGIDRVATEIRTAHREIADEFRLTANELRISADRHATLVALGTRLGLDSMRRLVATLAQTMQFGTPLAQALRILAAEARQEEIARFETRAARLPVLLTLPMIVFILPTVFLIVAGPAILQLMRTL